MRDSHIAQTHASSLSPMRRLLALLAPERRDIGLVIAFAIGAGVLTLATPIAVQALVNIVAFGGMSQPLVILAILLLGFLTLAGVLRAFKAYVVELLQRRLFVRVVTDLGCRLPRVHVASFDRNHGPELVNRFFDVLTVQKAGATLLLDGVAVVLQTTVGLLILAFYHPVLLAFDVVLLAGIAVILFVMGRGAVRTAIGESRAKYAVAASLEEIARHPLAFKQSGGPELARRRADALAVDYVEARRRHYRIVFRQIAGSFALQALAATALLALGGWLVIAGQLTLGQLVAAELIVSIVLTSFAKLGQKLESFYDLLAAVDKLGQLLDLPLERSEGEPLAQRAGGAELALHDVSFSYPGQRPALAHLNLHVNPGDRVQVVGRHGSGKSALADLLCGLRTPDSGRIELDGVDLRSLALESLRSQVVVVRGLELIDGTIAENVALGRPEVGSGEVRAALAAVGLLGEVNELPDGLGTVLGASGAPLSAGQSRCLMLARAIAGRPRLIVLDDILDDLDAQTRRRVLPALLRPDTGWTLVILSRHEEIFDAMHRTIRLAGGGGGQAMARTLSGPREVAE